MNITETGTNVNRQTERQKLYTPRHKSRGYNDLKIVSWMMNPTDTKLEQSVRRGTSTPSQCHFLIIKIIYVYDIDIRQNQWTTKYRSLTYIYLIWSIYVTHWSIIPSTTFLHQIVFKQNHWTIKYRSLTYIYLIWSIYVTHWSIIPTMMFIHQIILKILSKITRP